MIKLSTKQAIARLKAYLQRYYTELHITGLRAPDPLFSQALTIAIDALKEKQERKKIFEVNGINLTKYTDRYVKAICGTYKGKYGIEHIACIVYQLHHSELYMAYSDTCKLYSDIIVFVTASNEKRLFKKIKKTIEKIDAEIIESEVDNE